MLREPARMADISNWSQHTLLLNTFQPRYITSRCQGRCNTLFSLDSGSSGSAQLCHSAQYLPILPVSPSLWFLCSRKGSSPKTDKTIGPSGRATGQSLFLPLSLWCCGRRLGKPAFPRPRLHPATKTCSPRQHLLTGLFPSPPPRRPNTRTILAQTKVGKGRRSQKRQGEPEKTPMEL